MKWTNDRADNVDDRRGSGGGGMLVGSGLGTLIIAAIIFFLGGDPSAILSNGVGNAPQTEQRELTAEELQVKEFVRMLSAENNQTWTKIFSENGMQYREPKIVLFENVTQSGCGTAQAAMLWTEYKADLSHGTRTDVHMVFNIGEYRHRTPEWNPNIKLMHMSKLRQIRQHRELVHDMFSKDDHAKLSELVGYENPTTGLMALYYIDSCEPKKIDVYGFDWKETPTFTDMERKKDPLCYHDFDLEKKCCFDHFFKKSHIEWKN
jgi:hypothetical protein